MNVAIKEKNKRYDILFIILAISFILRLIFILVAPYDCTFHDIGSFVNLETNEFSKGHFGYIEYLYNYKHLPDFNPTTVWCFYNPPGFHALAAGALYLFHDVFGMSARLSFECLQLITLMFSSLSVWIIVKILGEFEINKKYKVLATALVAFSPFFTIYAGALNNDIQAIFFELLAIWFTIKWSKDPSIKNIIVIALAIGFGMMTKINIATVCLGIGTVMIIKLFKSKEKFTKILGQLVVFIMVCAPLALWFPILNYVKYDIPLGYVQPMSQNAIQYITNNSILYRFFGGLREQLSSAFYSIEGSKQFNIVVQTVRTSIIDELILEESGLSYFIVQVGLWVMLIVSILSVIAFVCNLLCNNKICKKYYISVELRVGMFLMLAGMLGSYILFCFNEPFVCTMNFRYIAAAVVFVIIGGFFVIDNLSEWAVEKRSTTLQNIKSIFIVLSVELVFLFILIDMIIIKNGGIKIPEYITNIQ